jgi:hypothetical protein
MPSWISRQRQTSPPGWRSANSEVVASDKLFFWLFQERSERLQPLLATLLADMEGYTFTAPVIKEREVRLDGLFLPPADQLPDKPAIILEAQMAADPEFLLRLYNESSLLLRHQYRQSQPLRHWRVLVICPSRQLNFGDPVPVAEFLRERLLWIELAPHRNATRRAATAPGPRLAPAARGTAALNLRRHPPAKHRHCAAG